MRMTTARLGSRLLNCLPARLRDWVDRRRQAPDPPRRVAATHRVEVVRVAGVRCVWLDRSRAGRGVVVHLHGGAYTTGPYPEQWDWLAAVGDGAGTAGVMVDYRLAGAAPYPAAVEDAERVITALADGGELRENGWILAGDSAGGGLALVVCRRLLDRGLGGPAALVLTAPWVDLAMENPTMVSDQRLDPSLRLRDLAVSAAAHAGGLELTHPGLSPLYADPTGLPPVHLNVGTHDLFLSDVRALQARLGASGVAVEYHEEPAAMHVYPTIVDSPEAKRTIAAQAAFIRRHLGGGDHK